MLPATFTDPNVAFLFLIVGALGLIWEWHAPGMFVPGIVGALLLLAGAYGLYQDAPAWYGVTLMAVAALLLTVEIKYYTHMVSGIAGAILLAFAVTILLSGPRQVSPSLAVAVSFALGIITIFLGFLGARARRGRHVTGPETLVGETGMARTEIHPEGAPPFGMVFVRGEYWQARSDQKIAVGQRVSIERVQDLVVYVREA